MKITKSYLKQVIKEELDALNNDMQESKLAGALLGVFTALLPSGNNNTTSIHDSADKVSVNDIQHDFVFVEKNIFISQDAQYVADWDKITSIVNLYKNSKDEMRNYFMNPEKLNNLIDLSSYDKKDLDIKQLKKGLTAVVDRKLSSLKFKIITDNEMNSHLKKPAAGVYYDSLNEINIVATLVNKNIDDADRIIKHELHHAISHYIDHVLNFYKDKESYFKFKPMYHSDNNSNNQEYEEYLQHPWENSAYSYALRKVFNLSSQSSVNDILNEFKKFRINIDKKGKFYAYEIPEQYGNVADKTTAISILIEQMKENNYNKEKIGESAVEQIGSAINPFTVKVEAVNNKYYLLIDLDSLLITLNKTAMRTTDVSKKGITI